MRKLGLLNLYRHQRSRSCQNTNSFRLARFSSDGGKEDTELDIPKVYDPGSVEGRILEKWKNINKVKNDSGYVFRMLLPPPNVTGKLHLGHFLTLAIEDTIARWKLMTGVNVEWIPGFDHAGIATQSVVNRKMSKSGDKGPSQLSESLIDFSSTNLQRIKEQIESTGALLDWDKGYYTLNESHSSTVKEAFIQLLESGLIRRGDGIVNWSCALETTIADIEVDELDFDKRLTLRVPNYDTPVEFGVLYYIAYRFLDTDQKLVVATSRPETMFGDVALAINPEDCRYVQFIGKRVINPINGSVIPVVADSRVKPDFGTGVVKITPAHDKLDFAIGSSLSLGSVNMLSGDGLLNENCGELQGIPRFAARKKVLEVLESQNAVLDEKPYSGALSICSRSGDVIEPRLVPHWFLQTQFLSDKIIQAVEDKSFLIVPENHGRTLVNQIMDSQDWCLSRQIKWGHRIPAFHHADFPEKWVVARDFESAVSKLEAKLGQKIDDASKVLQDPDVLDTWFSSALIPLSVSGWPESETHKEITLMETGHDILLFWVWRMTLLSLALLDRFPFRHVLLHGIVTDNFGRKMSKSRGNVIDPLHIINGISYKNLLADADAAFASGELDENEYNLRKVSLQRNHSDGFAKCGNDALRLTLLSQNIFDQQITLDLNYLDSCKRFSNKLWQALRFLKMHSVSQNHDSEIINGEQSENEDEELACKWLLSCLFELNKSAEIALNQAKFHTFAEAVRKFFYQELCDIYIELIKADVRTGLESTKYIQVMQYAFEVGVKIAHPIIPFVTEEIWSYLTKQKGSLLEQQFPSSQQLAHFHDPELMKGMDNAIDLTREIRAAKRRAGWSAKKIPNVYVEVDNKMEQRLHRLGEYICKLSASELKFGRYPPAEKALYGSFLVDVSGSICRIHIPLLDTSFRSSSQAKIEKLKLRLLKLQQQYENPSFQQNAPQEAKEKLKRKVENLIMQIRESNENNPNNQP